MRPVGRWFAHNATHCIPNRAVYLLLLGNMSMLAIVRYQPSHGSSVAAWLAVAVQFAHQGPVAFHARRVMRTLTRPEVMEQHARVAALDHLQADKMVKAAAVSVRSATYLSPVTASIVLRFWRLTLHWCELCARMCMRDIEYSKPHVVLPQWQTCALCAFC